MTRTAQCRCGALRIEVSVDPDMVVVCHCRQCQLRTGSAFGVAALFHKHYVKIEGPKAVYVEDVPTTGRRHFHFCPTCGATLYWESEHCPGRIDVAVGAFADPEFPPPSASICEESKHGWVAFGDDMAHNPKAGLDPYDPDLHLVVDGRFVEPAGKSNRTYRFVLPRAGKSVRLASRTNIPKLVRSNSNDRRRLGVAVRRLSLRSSGLSVEINQSNPLLADGFYKPGEALRWTDGDALIPEKLFAPFGDSEIEIEIEIDALPYPAAMTSVHEDRWHPEFYQPQPRPIALSPPATVSRADPGTAAAVNGPRWDGEFHIHADADCVQSLGAANSSEQYEGVAFSSSGALIAVAAAGARAIFVFRRKDDGRFEQTPFRRLSGGAAGLEFPHDVAFARIGDREYLAAIERRGVISVWDSETVARQGDDEPIVRIHGREAVLEFADALAFFPPNPDFLAGGSAAHDTINFYRRKKDSMFDYARQPETILRSPYIWGPDGIAFSACGTWLAVANHTNHTAVVFRLEKPPTTEAGPIYDPTPVAVIQGPDLRYPHSTAFYPVTNHLVVTNAGGQYAQIYAAVGDGQDKRWVQKSVAKIKFSPDHVFGPVNSENPEEGGAKGVAIYGNEIAICSPEMGLKIYSCTSA